MVNSTGTMQHRSEAYSIRNCCTSDQRHNYNWYWCSQKLCKGGWYDSIDNGSYAYVKGSLGGDHLHRSGPDYVENVDGFRKKNSHVLFAL